MRSVVSCMPVVLAVSVVSGSAGSLCLSLLICFSGLLDLHLFFKMLWPVPGYRTDVFCSWEQKSMRVGTRGTAAGGDHG